ncbi:ABC transporter substrate-binding protein, partial [Actinomyces radicidentis]
TALGEIFGKQDEAAALVADFNKALDRAKAAYDGTSTVMAVNVSGGEIGYVAPTVGRTYGPVFDLLGLKPALEVEGASSNHEGDDVSVEAIAESNPAWILVLDRDGAISADKADYKPAKDVLESNTALSDVTALRKGQVVYAPADTYTNESIITYTEILNDIADAFEGASGSTDGASAPATASEKA